MQVLATSTPRLDPVEDHFASVVGVAIALHVLVKDDFVSAVSGEPVLGQQNRLLALRKRGVDLRSRRLGIRLPTTIRLPLPHCTQNKSDIGFLSATQNGCNRPLTMSPWSWFGSSSDESKSKSWTRSSLRFCDDGFGLSVSSSTTNPLDSFLATRSSSAALACSTPGRSFTARTATEQRYKASRMMTIPLPPEEPECPA